MSYEINDLIRAKTQLGLNDAHIAGVQKIVDRLNEISKKGNGTLQDIECFVYSLKHYLCTLHLQFPKHIFPFVSYHIFYYGETYFFESIILKHLSKRSRILDIGCGACTIWRRNLELVKRKQYDVTCIDLNKPVLDVVSTILNKTKHIEIKYCNFFDVDDISSYEVFLFIEVVMQIPNPWEFFQHIFRNNKDATILMAHRIYPEHVSMIGSPFRKLFKNIPVLNTVTGPMMTMKDTTYIVEQGGGRIDSVIDLGNGRCFFVIKRADTIDLDH